MDYELVSASSLGKTLGNCGKTGMRSSVFDAACGFVGKGLCSEIDVPLGKTRLQDVSGTLFSERYGSQYSLEPRVFSSFYRFDHV